ncbi:hypothetical protein EVAR_92203_1 [Eumeta japonica]|uniref:Uncharacterized protein n=1 Tax=Eumeta variegata TaxID=151549 RepID=A0A4C1TMC2_EUMVA|nr:hypothetical protein EVAR_92203_1 [Eumeta japonica]
MELNKNLNRIFQCLSLYFAEISRREETMKEVKATRLTIDDAITFIQLSRNGKNLNISMLFAHFPFNSRVTHLDYKPVFDVNAEDGISAELPLANARQNTAQWQPPTAFPHTPLPAPRPVNSILKFESERRRRKPTSGSAAAGPGLGPLPSYPWLESAAVDSAARGAFSAAPACSCAPVAAALRRRVRGPWHFRRPPDARASFCLLPSRPCPGRAPSRPQFMYCCAY